MSASPQRLSDTSRPITNASIFFPNCWRQKTDDRRTRRVGGLDMPWHVVVCQVATRAAGMAWTCAYGQRTKNLHDSGLRQCVGRGQHILQQQL